MYVHVYIYIYRHEHALKAVYEMPRKNVFWLGNEQVCRSQEVKIWCWFSDDVMVMSDALEITAIQRVLDVLSDVSF